MYFTRLLSPLFITRNWGRARQAALDALYTFLDTNPLCTEYKSAALSLELSSSVSACMKRQKVLSRTRWCICFNFLVHKPCLWALCRPVRHGQPSRDSLIPQDRHSLCASGIDLLKVWFVTTRLSGILLDLRFSHRCRWRVLSYLVRFNSVYSGYGLRRFGRIVSVFCFPPASCLACDSNHNMGAACSSETSGPSVSYITLHPSG